MADNEYRFDHTMYCQRIGFCVNQLSVDADFVKKYLDQQISSVLDIKDEDVQRDELLHLVQICRTIKIHNKVLKRVCGLLDEVSNDTRNSLKAIIREKRKQNV